MMSVWGKNLFTGEELSDEKSWIQYHTMMIGSVKNHLEHELDRPVSFREAMEEMKLDQKFIDMFSFRYNIDDDSKYELPELNNE